MLIGNQAVLMHQALLSIPAFVPIWGTSAVKALADKSGATSLAGSAERALKWPVFIVTKETQHFEILAGLAMNLPSITDWTASFTPQAPGGQE
jgi:hypothetical protein